MSDEKHCSLWFIMITFVYHDFSRYKMSVTKSQDWSEFVQEVYHTFWAIPFEYQALPVDMCRMYVTGEDLFQVEYTMHTLVFNMERDQAKSVVKSACLLCTEKAAFAKLNFKVVEGFQNRSLISKLLKDLKTKEI